MKNRPVLMMIVFSLAMVAVLGCRPKASGPDSSDKNSQFAKAVAAAKKYQFTDVTQKTGIDFTYQNGREANNNSILESLGGGAGLVDFDGDGWLDVFTPGGGGYEGRRIHGLPAKLYRNLGDWHFVDVSQASGNGFPADRYSHGCFAADYDNDGFDDLLVTGYEGVQLWKNMGDGTFSETHADAGLVDDLWSAAAAWGDFDDDGLLDLYLSHYVNWSFTNHPKCTAAGGQTEICSPRRFQGLPDRMFRNQGDGTFVDITDSAGLRKDGKGLGVITADIDVDGDLDIYVANDTTENFLYRNDGQAVFTEVAAISGCAVDEKGTPNGSMGVDVGDFNLDGRPDIWVANFEIETFALYRNDGKGRFLHVSRATGVTALGGLYVGFGTAFLDVDLDGDEDLLVANGHVIKYPRSAPLLQKALLLVNEETKRFRVHKFDEKSYFSQPHAGRGLATGDLDADGDLDLVFANNLEKLAIQRNDVVRSGDWLQIDLVGRQSNRNAVGAILTLVSSDRRQMRQVKSGVSYLSTCDRRQLWGIPQGTSAERVEIQWPSGKTQQLDVSTVKNTLLRVYEPLE